MRTGVRICLDLGSKRIGVAKCDPSGLLAAPYDTWESEGETDLALRVNRLVEEIEAIEVVVGLPVDLRGQEGVAAAAVRERAVALAALVAVPVRLVDERLTTVTARRQLRESGFDSLSDKALIDAAAATVLLEHALDAERRSGKAPGEVLPKESQ